MVRWIAIPEKDDSELATHVPPTGGLEAVTALPYATLETAKGRLLPGDNVVAALSNKLGRTMKMLPDAIAAVNLVAETLEVGL